MYPNHISDFRVTQNILSQLSTSFQSFPQFLFQPKTKFLLASLLKTLQCFSACKQKLLVKPPRHFVKHFCVSPLHLTLQAHTHTQVQALGSNRLSFLGGGLIHTSECITQQCLTIQRLSSECGNCTAYIDKQCLKRGRLFESTVVCAIFANIGRNKKTSHLSGTYTLLHVTTCLPISPWAVSIEDCLP